MANEMVAVSLAASGPVDGPEAQAAAAGRTRVQTILTTMRQRFRLCVEAEAELRRNMLEDLKFSNDEHWPPELKTAREIDGRPCLTIDRLSQSLRQVTNQQRATRPAISVNPKDGAATDEIAEVYQGLIRDIEVQSDAEVAYSTAADMQARIGLGFWRVVTEWVDEGDSFAQALRIKRMRNSFAVYVDPYAQEADRSDMRYAFVVEDLPPDAFEARWGSRDDYASLTSFTSIGDQMPLWHPGTNIRIVEYWWVEDVPDALVHLTFPGPDPRTAVVRKSAVNLDALQASGVVVGWERPHPRRQIKMALCNGVGILEGNADRTDGYAWKGQWIPIVPVLGEEIDVDGRLDIKGMVRNAKDPSRAYDYWVSAATEAVALAPRAPWVGAEGQFEGYEEEWDQANVRNFSRLTFKPIVYQGQLLPAPRREAVEPPIRAMTALIQQADNDLKATTGFYDASLGERGPEQSGKAILARQKQGEIGNSNYLDNLSRAIRHTGRILVDLIPHTYDTARVIRTVGPDLVSATLVQHHPGPPPPALQAGKLKVVDLTQGRYDVAISVGPSFQSLREEASQQLGDLLGRAPNLFQLFGDLWLSNLNAPWAKQAAQRAKELLPPALKSLTDQDQSNADLPPEAKAQIAHMGDQLHQTAQALQHAMQTMQQMKAALDGEQAKAQAEIATHQADLEQARTLKEMELASRERIAALTVQGKVDGAAADRAAALVLQHAGAAETLMSQRLEHAHDLAMQPPPPPPSPGPASSGPPVPSGAPPPSGPAGPPPPGAPPPGAPAAPHPRGQNPLLG